MTTLTAQSPMYRPLTWWSRADLDGFVDRIGAALRRWSLDWGIPVGDFQACNASDLPARDFGLAQWRPMREVTSGPAWIASTTEDLATHVESLLFGVPTTPSENSAGSLASEVAAEATQALRAALADALQIAPAQHHTTAPADSLASPPMRYSRPWSGAVCIFARIGESQGGGVWLHLSPDCATALRVDSKTLRCQEPTAAPLTPLDEAVEGMPLELRVELAAVQLDLGTLQALQVGDVIPLAHDLDQPLYAHVGQQHEDSFTQDGMPLCRAYLGTRHHRRAVQLVRSGGISL